MTNTELCKEAGVNSCPAFIFARGVRHTLASIRIKMMALFRNKPLQPLYRCFDQNNNTDSLFPYIQPRPSDSELRTKVLFFNDIWFSYKDVIRLLNTNRMNYDLVCALDFHFINLYDLWVLRDINGLVVSQSFPYFWDYESFWNVTFGLPVRVYSCWNGLVIFDASVLSSNPGIKFRSWNQSEVRAPTPLNKFSIEETRLLQKNVFNDNECSVSECQLFSKDLWAFGKNKIYINPTVKVDYNAYYRVLRQLLSPVTNVFTSIIWILKGPHALNAMRNTVNGTVKILDVKCGIDHTIANG